MSDGPAGRQALAAHGVYFLVTGVAPFASRRAFEAVTGRKREWWLVQTVGALTASLGAGGLAAAARDRGTPEVLAMAGASSAGLAAIDVVYALRGRISPVYLADAAVQAALIGLLARGLTGPRGARPPHAPARGRSRRCAAAVGRPGRRG